MKQSQKFKWIIDMIPKEVSLKKILPDYRPLHFYGSIGKVGDLV